MRKTKKPASILLALALVFALLPQASLPVRAADSSGKCGENLTWSFDEASGTLTISGTGEMDDYEVYNEYDEDGRFLRLVSDTPWRDFTARITCVRMLDGLTAIGECAFRNCAALKDVTIPDSVESIGAVAFSGCGSLPGITIPEKVTAIGESLFSDCSGLQSIRLHDGVTDIGWGAFSGCGSLQSMTIPKGVNAIRGRTFSGCSGLQSVSIPENVTEIEPEAFFGCAGLRSITIPNGVTFIGEAAFSGCSSLESAALPESLEFIGVSAFADTAIERSPDNTDNGLVYLEGWLISAEKALNELDHVSIRPGTVGIADSVFENSPLLTTASLPEGLKYIGFNAFANCGKLSALRLPDSIREIGSDALSGTALFRDPDNWSDGLMYLDHWLIASDWELAEAKIRPGTVGIAGGAFRSDMLRSATVPEGLRFISSSAFAGCARMRRVTIPDSVESIGSAAFWGCASLESFSIPQGVTRINEGAFFGCDSLTSLTIPDSVTRIGDAAFEGFRSLATLVIPEGVESIGDNAFSGWFDTKATVLILNRDCAICDSRNTFADSFSVTIAGYPGSTAEAHAKKYGIAFRNIEECPFLDVAEDAYYTAPVVWAVEKGVTKGTGNFTFSPDSTCTRAQVVTFLWRAMGEPEPAKTDNPFADVKEDQYYYKAVLWAVEQGVTTGTSATAFSPDAGCTRAQVVTFLWRAEGRPAPASAANPFRDAADGQYYSEAVLWAVEKGITKGTAADRFSPDSTCTRGQIVTFLHRDLA